MRTATETGKKPHILFVDDIPGVANIIRKVLDGYRLTYVQSGAEALQQVAEEAPDLILLDVEMPKMGGYEVCEHLKQSSRYCDIPVIFLTAMDSSSDVVKGFNVGGGRLCD